MKDESGNVLFFIMVGVLLYAALSFVMTKSDNRNNLDAQQANLYANELIQYGENLRQAVATVRAKNGCALEQISFDPPPYDGSSIWAAVNSNAPSDNSCNVFHDNGGGADFKLDQLRRELGVPYDSYIKVSSWSGLTGVGTTCAAPECSELYLIAVSKKSYSDDICENMNKILKNDTLIPIQSLNGMGWGTPYVGTFGNEVVSDAKINGLKAFCHTYGPAPEDNIFVYILAEQ